MTDDAARPEPDVGGSPAIRRLGPADPAFAHALLDVFAEAFEDPDRYAAARPDGAYLERLLGSETFVAIVALQDGAVVGGLAAYELRKLERATSELYLYDLAVRVEHRRRGVATALIDALRAVARERGAAVVFVQADHGDDPAIALYTKLGTREDVMHFDIAPGPRPPAVP
jgi:aminoglycoside 3-N-acetyltransferase I